MGMATASKIENPDVARVFDGYPPRMRRKMMRLRQLVLETALETEGVDMLEETLKWGEPACLAKGGSTVTIGWKKKAPDTYGIYFICNTPLVKTFRELYADLFTLEDNRAILFEESDELPVEELRHCISIAFTFHRPKRLPLLGA